MNAKKERPLVVVCREIPEIGIKLLTPKYRVVMHKGDVLTVPQLKRFVKGAAGIVSLLTDKIDDEIIKAAGPQLKIVANYAVGFDNIDLDAVARAGLVATNTPGQLTESVAEHSLALLLAASRRIVEADAYVRDGQYKQWEPMKFWGQPLLGKTIGLVGSGRIGAAFGIIAHNGLRARILYHDVCANEVLERSAGASRVGLRELLRRSDVVSLHVPLLASTRHLIGRRELELMKPESILINTARGPVVDEDALTEALMKRRIFAAALDVFEHEPRIAATLRRLPNVVFTPHIASATRDAREQMSIMAARNIVAVLSGKLPVNPISLPTLS